MKICVRGLSLIILAALATHAVHVKQLLACSGSPYGPRHLNSIQEGVSNFGYPDGVVFRIFVYDESAAEPATIEDILNEGFSLSLSAEGGDSDRIISGELIEAEHTSLPGTFIWRSSEGPLELGNYRLMGCDECSSNRMVTIVEPFEPTEFTVDLQEVSLSEERVNQSECCQRASCDPNEGGPFCTASEESQYCRLCWVSGYTYPKILTLNASRSQSEALDQLLSVQAVTTLGDMVVPSHRLEEFTFTLQEDFVLPEQVCAKLIATDLITGQSREGEERCLSSSSLRTLERIQPEHSEQELSEWRSCEGDLTPYQRSRLDESSSTSPEGESPLDESSSEQRSRLDESSSTSPEGESPLDESSSEEGCAQSVDHRSFWWVLCIFLCGAMLKRSRSKR